VPVITVELDDFISIVNVVKIRADG
jgi:hypothetical protein